MSKKEVEIYYFRESLLQSVLSDIFSYVMLVGSFGINHLYIGSKVLAGILLVIFLMCSYSKAKSKTTVFYNKEDFKKHVEKL